MDKYNNTLQVHIRQYEKNEKGQLFPSKLGICLTQSRFATLQYFADLIKPQIEKLRNKEGNVSFRFHLGGGIFLSANSDFPTINVRRYFLPDGQTSPHPTKKGIALRLREWDAIVEKFDDITKLLDKDIMPCFLVEDHHLNMEMGFNCPECNPFQPFIVQDYGI